MKTVCTILITTIFLFGFILIQPNNSTASGYDSSMQKGSGGQIEEGPS